MSSRSYRVIYGVAYPNMFVGASRPSHITRPDYYHDDAVRLSPSEARNFVGKPICEEHDERREVGVISDAFVDDDNNMCITARIWTDTPDGERVYERINSGNLQGFSVGYKFGFAPDGSVSQQREYDHVAVCDTPYFPGMGVRVTASDAGAYKNKSQVVFFKILANMEEEKKIEKLDAVNPDAAKLVKHHDDMLKQRESDARELERLRAELQRERDEKAALQAREQKQLADFKAEKQGELRETLDVFLDNMRAEKGADAQLDAEFVKDFSDTFSHPEGYKSLEPIIASARGAQKQRVEFKAMQDKLKQMEEQRKQEQEAQNQLLARVEAHVKQEPARAPAAAPAATVPVTASAGQSYNKLFRPRIAPSEYERKLFRDTFGREPDMTVHASAAAAEPDAPEHPHSKNLPHSWRNIPNMAGMFNKFTKYMPVYANMGSAIKATSTVDLPNQ